ncbi:hypothetical protein M3231_23160 [Neobacillus mesonae]|nr:hypothetical protein [Neobacillus mesonae]
MNLLTREKEAKIALLESIVRSQTALSRMLEIAADGYELTGMSSSQLIKHIELIAKCQHEMAGSIQGLSVSLNSLKKGNPAPPWSP